MDPAQALDRAAGTLPLPYAAQLVRFADAVVSRNEDELGQARSGLRQALGEEAVTRAAAVIAAFEALDRVAETTGIQLDFPIVLASSDLRRRLGLDRYPSARGAAPGPGRRLLTRVSEPLFSWLLRRWLRSRKP